MAKKKFAEVFAPFIEETMSSFGYLVRDFGFEHFDTSVVSYECSIGFRKNDRVAVTVMCEAGAMPWVRLTGRIDKRAEQAALDFVIQQRCPEREPEVPDEFPVSDKDVARLLRHYAATLRECASDFLEGDPSVLREVRKLVDADYKRRQGEMLLEERQGKAKKSPSRKPKTA